MNAPQLFQNFEALGVVTPDTPVKVGRTYLVMCGVFPVGWHIPIIPFLHSDSELGVGFDHYHVDGRFYNKGLLRSQNHVDVNRVGRTLQIIQAPDTDTWRGLRGLEIVELKCLRTASGIPLEKYDQWYSEIYNNWTKKYEGKKCHGRKCPHYGARMHERKGGVLECPLHGLFADKKTERIISRSKALERMK